MADEVEHARSCYAAASAFLGDDLGPGPLEISDFELSPDLHTFIEQLVRDACIGDTLAAVEARHAASRAEFPWLRTMLTRINADETRHAALGSKTLQRILEQQRPSYAHTRSRIYLRSSHV